MNKFTKVKKALAVSLCSSMLFSGAPKTSGMNCTCIYDSANSIKETINNAVKKIVDAVVETGKITIADELWQQTIYWVIGSFAAEVFSKILFSILESIYDNCLKEKIESCCCKKAKTVIDESINDFTKEENIKKIIKEAINEAKKDGGRKYKDENIVKVKNLYNKTCYLLNVLFNKGVFGGINNKLIKDLNSITNLELKKSRLLINGAKIFDQKSAEDLGKEVAINLAQVISNLINEEKLCLKKELIGFMGKEKITVFEAYVLQAKDKSAKFQECFLRHVIDKMMKLFNVSPIDEDFEKNKVTFSKLNKHGIFRVKNIFVKEDKLIDVELSYNLSNEIKIKGESNEEDI